jgi:hypothetical protein
LLTKEACAAIATLLTLPTCIPSRKQFDRVGHLLISTLTSLKHAGAAFAARDALQQIASFCFNPAAPLEIRCLPIDWSSRLFDEITLIEKVRNSTLRRSTGYALGFMAILRAEAKIKSTSPRIGKATLDRLLALTLPLDEKIKELFARLDIAPIQSTFIAQNSFEVRCLSRVSNVFGHLSYFL